VRRDNRGADATPVLEDGQGKLAWDGASDGCRCNRGRPYLVLPLSELSQTIPTMPDKRIHPFKNSDPIKQFDYSPFFRVTKVPVTICPSERSTPLP
jgi:hypothetical protein